MCIWACVCAYIYTQGLSRIIYTTNKHTHKHSHTSMHIPSDCVPVKSENCIIRKLVLVVRLSYTWMSVFGERESVCVWERECVWERVCVRGHVHSHTHTYTHTHTHTHAYIPCQSSRARRDPPLPQTHTPVCVCISHMYINIMHTHHFPTLTHSHSYTHTLSLFHTDTHPHPQTHTHNPQLASLTYIFTHAFTCIPRIPSPSLTSHTPRQMGLLQSHTHARKSACLFIQRLCLPNACVCVCMYVCAVFASLYLLTARHYFLW
jgi:hypothetical protein